MATQPLRDRVDLMYRHSPAVQHVVGCIYTLDCLFSLFSEKVRAGVTSGHNSFGKCLLSSVYMAQRVLNQKPPGTHNTES